jgi:hypothetical protein
MSELKRPSVLQLRHNNSEGFVYAYEVDEIDKYLSEVDKVLAEKEADYKEACGRLQTANLIKDEQLAATRHQKYKRCLAMAYVEWLKQVIIGLHPESILYRKAFKRERKWKELAEKFKEAR